MLLDMKRFLIFALNLIFFLPVFSQQTKILTAEKHNEYGLVYTLPTTAFQIEITVVKETYIAGPYSKYSKIFTSDSQVISKDAINWNIETVKVYPYGVSNDENAYLMQLKPGSLTYIGVAEDGMLLSINKEPENNTLYLSDSKTIEGTPITGKEFLEYVNEDFIAAQSSYKKAQLLAEEIMDIRDAKVSLTRGTAETMPTDGRQLEIMLASLEKQEKALMNAFTGGSWKEKIVRTFSIIPKEEGKMIICKLNKSEGLIDENSSNGEPIYANISIVEEAQLPMDSKGEEKKLPKDAVVYCIPGVGSLNITYKNQSLFKKSYPMSQFGMVFGLNPSIFTDKKEPSYAIFDPTTGALKELSSIKD